MVIRSNKKDVSKVGLVSLEDAREYVQKYILEPRLWGEDVVDERETCINDATAGDPQARIFTEEIIEETLTEIGAEVENMSVIEAAKEIYKTTYGLDILQDLLDDDEVNEIRVNRSDMIFVMKNLKNEKVDLSFRDDEHVMDIVRRMILHDSHVSLDKGTGTCESSLKDGTRITATCRPVGEVTSLVLRKQEDRVFSFEELVENHTIDDTVAEILKTLILGRCTILITGGVGSGKTSMLRSLFAHTNPIARTVSVETDRELFLTKHFPERDIVEFEAHPQIGCTLNHIIRHVLRYGNNILIMGEFRGEGEARSAIEACATGFHGSFATAHAASALEAVQRTGRMLILEGLTVNTEIAEATVASAFNVIIQMVGDSTRGFILLGKITEIYVENGKVVYNDLVQWKPYGDIYNQGNWEIVGCPSSRLLERLKIYDVPDSQLRHLGWL